VAHPPGTRTSDSFVFFFPGPFPAPADFLARRVGNDLLSPEATRTPIPFGFWSEGRPPFGERLRRFFSGGAAQDVFFLFSPEPPGAWPLFSSGKRRLGATSELLFPPPDPHLSRSVGDRPRRNSQLFFPPLPASAVSFWSSRRSTRFLLLQNLPSRGSSLILPAPRRTPFVGGKFYPASSVHSSLVYPRSTMEPSLPFSLAPSRRRRAQVGSLFLLF